MLETLCKSSAFIFIVLQFNLLYISSRYGLRGMNSDFKEVRLIISSLTPKIASVSEELNGQALGNSL